MKHLIQRKVSPRIITFGGCLSRFTAEHFVKMYGGEILSVVYNNRFDLFVDKFVNNASSLPDYDIFKSLIKPTAVQEIIYKRQTREGIGIYYTLDEYTSLNGKSAQKTPDKYSNFIDLLNIDGDQIDLLIIDNYIDLVGKSVILKNSDYESAPFFISVDYKKQSKFYQICGYETVSDMIKCLDEIIVFIKIFCKNIKICFLSFPADMYPSDHSIHARSKEFNKDFCNNKIDFSVECHILNNVYSKSNEPQHFMSAYYCSLAQSIYSALYA